jgi:hypothetical protein
MEHQFDFFITPEQEYIAINSVINKVDQQINSSVGLNFDSKELDIHCFKITFEVTAKGFLILVISN